jgi:type VI secretion system secreted protein VgrG
MPRVMEITTPLGDDVLLFHGMHAHEELSRPSEYQIDLLSTKPDIDVDKILGKNVTVKLALPDDSIRHFNGYVTRFTQHGAYGRYYRYVAVVRTWLWFLTRTADCRIFQEMTVQEILDAVFADHPEVADVSFELTGSYRKWTYCVQYRETDFNFVSRLMEHEGMYYYFRHTDGHNTLVVTDSTSKHTPSPGYEEIPLIQPERIVRPELEHISSWEFSREIQPGLYVHDDYDFERPSVKLRTQKAVPRKYALSTYEVYDAPGNYVQKPDGDQYASVRIDEYATQFETAQAATNSRGIRVGSLFTLLGNPREDQNVEHLIVAANHELQYSDYEGIAFSEGASCRCGFVAMSSAQQFRPRRITPKPFVQGPQTAIVVGPPGEEIHTDQHGRVKVQFHWDRRGEKNEKSSCWIRVSHPWAGKGWGLVSTPRIGQEVVVDFIEGDPDQPIVTGRVYNAECAPPFGFPAGAVISGVKSQTHKGAGYNEMSLDDTAGNEKITIHGQFDMNTTVEHDQTSTIKNNRTTSVVVDDVLNVDANRTMHVKAKLTETVDAGQEVTVSAGYKETISGGSTSGITGGATSTIDGGSTNTITGGMTNTIDGGLTNTVTGASTTTVNGHASKTITSGEEKTITGSKDLNLNGPFTQTINGPLTTSATGAIEQIGGATIDIHATAPGTYTSGAKLTFAVGGSAVEITPAAITITGGGSTVKIDGSGVSLNGAKISLNC